MITDETINDIIEKYFQKNNILTDHQISSYNNLIDKILPNILYQFFPISIYPVESFFKSIIK